MIRRSGKLQSRPLDFRSTAHAGPRQAPARTIDACAPWHQADMQNRFATGEGQFLLAAISDYYNIGKKRCTCRKKRKRREFSLDFISIIWFLCVIFLIFCFYLDYKKQILLRQHRTIAEASAVESPIRQETIGFPSHFFARAHNFKPPGRACQPEADSPMRT